MAPSADIFSEVRKRHSNWASVQKAEGEYFDFSKFDFAAVEKSGLGKIELKLPNAMLPKGILLAPLSSLVSPSFSLAKQHLLKRGIDLSDDKLLSWHGAHVQDGILLHVPAGVSAPVIHIKTQASGSSALHHLIVLEKGAKAEVIIEAESNGKGSSSSTPSLHTDLSESILEEDAQLTLTTVQNYPLTDWAFSSHYHHLSKFAKLTHSAAAIGALRSRTRAVNHLDGARARADSYQFFLGKGEQLMDMESRSIHHVPDTEGLMTCKGAMDGHSIGVYKGMIVIEQAAINTVSHQSGAVLLLSEDSKANIIPSLQVANDQVEAGHGATVGSLDEKEMLYLRSRGLDESEARLLALCGYFNQLISKIPGAASRQRLGQITRQYIEGLPKKISLSGKSIRPAPIAVPGEEARPSTHYA